MDESNTEEYELLPHREIEELKEELAKLKEFEIAPSKKMHVSLLELNTKLDKLITIFEDAGHEMRVEEGGLGFSEKMRPLLEKMTKILEQNSEIAEGILALADMVKEIKEGRGSMPQQPRMQMDMPRMPEPMQMSPPPLPSNLPNMPLPPLPKRRSYGL